MNEYLFFQVLILVGQCLDGTYHLHALHHFPEGGKTLAVRVPVPAKIKGWLVANTNKEFGGGTAGFIARHGDNPVIVRQSGLKRGFMGNGRDGIDRLIIEKSTLYHFYLHIVAGLIIEPYHSVKNAAGIVPLVNVFQEVTRSDRGPVNV